MSKKTQSIFGLPDWAPHPPDTLAAAIEETERIAAEREELGAAVRAARFLTAPDRTPPEVRERYRIALDAYNAATRSMEQAGRIAANEALVTSDEWKPKLAEAYTEELAGIRADVVALAERIAGTDPVRGVINRLDNPELLQGKMARFERPEPSKPPSLEFAGTLSGASIPASDLPRLLAAIAEHARALELQPAADASPRRLVPAQG